MRSPIMLIAVMMAIIGNSLPSFAADSWAPANTSQLISYLKSESALIMREGDRLRHQAKRLIGESDRLSREASRLTRQAAQLDKLWRNAASIAPNRFHDFPGRDRSQKQMRSDADRLVSDADDLKINAKQLEDESTRLWNLASAVDPRAQLEIIKRLRDCCSQKTALDTLRLMVQTTAETMGLRYKPS